MTDNAVREIEWKEKKIVIKKCEKIKRFWGKVTNIKRDKDDLTERQQ